MPAYYLFFLLSVIYYIKVLKISHQNLYNKVIYDNLKG